MHFPLDHRGKDEAWGLQQTPQKREELGTRDNDFGVLEVSNPLQLPSYWFFHYSGLVPAGRSSEIHPSVYTCLMPPLVSGKAEWMAWDTSSEVGGS